MNILQMRLIKTILPLFLFLATIHCSEAQTTLGAGDIAITGFNSDAPDGFSFVLLVDVAAGTQICFTDNGWNCSSATWRTGEGTLCWNAPAGGVTAGQQIKIDNAAGWAVTSGCGTVSSSGTFDLANGGDQIIAYQGAAATPTFVYGLNYDNAGWKATDPTSANESCLPTGLTNGTNAISRANDLDNQKYNCPVTSDSKANLLSAISNTSNWSGSDATTQTLPPCGSFSVSGSTPACGGGGGSSDTCIVVNEFQASPLCLGCDGASTSTGEWIEIYNKCNYSVDISCYVVCLTDEDGVTNNRKGECVTIPSGTTLGANEVFWLGGNKSNCAICDFPAGTWGSLDLNWHTCSGCVTDIDGDGSGFIGVLDNNGEDIAIFNSGGALVDAVTYGSYTNITTSQTFGLGASGGCPATSVTIPPSSSFGNACDGSGGGGYIGGGEGCGRNCDGTWELRDHNGAIDLSPGVAENCILPVELLSFTAAVANNKIELEWITLSETNSDYFEIHRSTDGVSFQKIGETDAAGNSAQENIYLFTDGSPLNSIQYYRLKQVDFNGSFSYSHIVTVSYAPHFFIAGMIYPNPVRDMLNIEVLLPEQSDVSVAISNVMGQTVLEQREIYKKGKATLKVNTASLPPGVYILRVISPGGQQQAKFVKSQQLIF